MKKLLYMPRTLPVPIFMVRLKSPGMATHMHNDAWSVSPSEEDSLFVDDYSSRGKSIPDEGLHSWLLLERLMKLGSLSKKKTPTRSPI